MAVVVSGPPERVVRAADAAARRQSWVTRLFGAPPLLSISLHVFVAELGALANAEGLEAVARPVGWQFVAPRKRRRLPFGPSREEPLGIQVDERGTSVQIEQSPFIRDAEHFILERGPEVTDDATEVRLLRIPEVRLMAIWIGRGGSDDELIPLAPAPDEINVSESYGPAEFLRVASAIATRILGVYEGQRYRSNENDRHSEELGS
jgi:hypothetical protein